MVADRTRTVVNKREVISAPKELTAQLRTETSKSATTAQQEKAVAGEFSTWDHKRGPSNLILGESEKTCWKRWHVGRDLKNGNELPGKEKWAGDGKGRFMDGQKSRCKVSEKRQMAKCRSQR